MIVSISKVVSVVNNKSSKFNSGTKEGIGLCKNNINVITADILSAVWEDFYLSVNRIEIYPRRKIELIM